MEHLHYGVLHDVEGDEFWSHACISIYNGRQCWACIQVLYIDNLQHYLPHLSACVLGMVHNTLIYVLQPPNCGSDISAQENARVCPCPLVLGFLPPSCHEILITGALVFLNRNLVLSDLQSIHT